MELIEDATLEFDISFRTIFWTAWVPKKVLVCCWQAIHNRLPTREQHTRRGLHVPDKGCSKCSENMETLDHILIWCPDSVELWGKKFLVSNRSIPLHRDIRHPGCIHRSWLFEGSRNGLVHYQVNHHLVNIARQKHHHT